MFLYYAVFELADDGINVRFPDLDGAFTGAKDMHEALFLAKDLLAGWLINAQDDGETLPDTSSPSEFNTNENELVVPIEVNLDFYRAKFDNQLIKKTLTIPKYLNIEAEALGINFSQTLTEALKDKLSV